MRYLIIAIELHRLDKVNRLEINKEITYDDMQLLFDKQKELRISDGKNEIQSLILTYKELWQQ
jgi:hypothetical protein